MRIKSTYTLLLPLVFGVCHHALHVLLHAPPLRQLPLQLLLPRLQLLLERSLVLLIHVCRLLQDVDLAGETKTCRCKEETEHKMGVRSKNCTLYSSVLDFFSSRSSSALWLAMTLSFSPSLFRWS